MSITDIEERLKRLEDLESIKLFHQRYIDLMDNLEYEAVPELFTSDGTVEIRNFGVRKGRKEIEEMYVGILAKKRGDIRYDAHLAVHPDIQIEGDVARGTWLIYMLFSKPTIYWVQGRNECEYRKVNGVWKFSKLKFTRTLSSDPEQYP